MCLEAGLPKPIYNCQYSDFQINFQKDIYTEDYLNTIGINQRQIKAILFAKKNGKITNSDYQKICDVSRQTASRDLSNLLDEKHLLKRTGDVGAGTTYKLIDS
jgi:ATP-dependent DNA helicase RecG